MLLALIVRFTLREPPRTEAAPAKRDSVWQVLGFMLRMPSFVYLSGGAALHAFYGYGAASVHPGVPDPRARHVARPSSARGWASIALTTGTLGTFLGGFDQRTGSRARTCAGTCACRRSRR